LTKARTRGIRHGWPFQWQVTLFRYRRVSLVATT
jgi:hypothetical protein